MNDAAIVALYMERILGKPPTNSIKNNMVILNLHGLFRAQ